MNVINYDGGHWESISDISKRRKLVQRTELDDQKSKKMVKSKALIFFIRAELFLHVYQHTLLLAKSGVTSFACFIRPLSPTFLNL